jgi:glycosyltransferase involved in cell wall biosynthesis
MLQKRVLIFTEEYFKATTGMFTVVETLYGGVGASNYKIDIDVCTNFEHWTTRKDVIKLPRLSLAEYLRSRTKYIRQNYFIFKILIFTLTFPLYFFDKLTYLVYLTHFIRVRKYDIVNVHNGGWPAGWVSRLIVISAKLSKCKVIYSIHNSPQYEYFFMKGYVNNLFRFYSIFIDIFIYPSVYLETVFSSVHTSKSCTIHNATNDFAADRSSQNSSVSNDILKIGFVGSLNSLKNPKDIIYLLNSMESKISFCKVVHYGFVDELFLKKFQIDKDYLMSLETYVFNGFVEDKNLIYSSFDILLAPSRMNESFGMVVIEALSFGLPVVCFDGNAYPELITNNYNGFLYKEFDDLLVIIKRYSNNRKLISEHSNNARKAFEEKFGTEQFIVNYCNLFNV